MGWDLYQNAGRPGLQAAVPLGDRAALLEPMERCLEPPYSSCPNTPMVRYFW